MGSAAWRLARSRPPQPRCWRHLPARGRPRPRCGWIRAAIWPAPAASGTRARLRTFGRGPFSFTVAFQALFYHRTPIADVWDDHDDMLACDDGRHNPNGGFVMAQAAPLDRCVRSKGGPHSHEPPQQKSGRFATLQGYRCLGSGRAALVRGSRLRLECVGDRCTLVP